MKNPQECLKKKKKGLRDLPHVYPGKEDKGSRSELGGKNGGLRLPHSK